MSELRWTDELVIAVPAPNLWCLAHVARHDPALADPIEVAEVVEAEGTHDRLGDGEFEMVALISGGDDCGWLDHSAAI